MRHISIDQKTLIERMVAAAYGVPGVEFNDLPSDVKTAWAAAADAGVRYFFECLGGTTSGHTLTDVPASSRRVN